MPFPLLPTWTCPSVDQIVPDVLKSKGIELVMLDFDNTIVPYTTCVPTPEVANWLETIRRSGLKLCVVSNSHNSRVPDFCVRYGIDCITHAKKPSAKGIDQCLLRYGVSRAQAVLIGDQIYTDTLGGNCAGVRTLLVRSIHNHSFWLKLRHVAEMPFILMSKNRRLNDEKLR